MNGLNSAPENILDFRKKDISYYSCNNKVNHIIEGRKRYDELKDNLENIEELNIFEIIDFFDFIGKDIEKLVESEKNIDIIITLLKDIYNNKNEYLTLNKKSKFLESFIFNPINKKNYKFMLKFNTNFLSEIKDDDIILKNLLFFHINKKSNN